jgi:hypothetical protein
MILFFAGHGSSFEAPSNLIAPNGRVEAICPVDERTKNEAREDVHAIPDYVLVRLLSELADKKGNNIVRSCSRLPVCSLMRSFRLVDGDS